jgi:hypothetical protein
MKTLNEQIDRIKSMMGIINEQKKAEKGIFGLGDPKQYVNCRGARLGNKGLIDTEGEYGASYGASIPNLTWWQDITIAANNEISSEGLKELENFKTIYKGDKPDDFFRALNRETERFNTYNSNPDNVKFFSDKGEILAPAETNEYKLRVWANGICNLINTDPWLIYYMEKLGKRTDTRYGDFYKIFQALEI